MDGTPTTLVLDHDQQIIQSCFDAMLGTLTELGLEVTFSTDMTEWADMMRRAPNTSGVVNPTFDPAESELSADNAFWARLAQVSTGTAIACIANRFFVTEDYVDLIRTQRLWYSHGPRRLLDLAVPANMPLIAGRVGTHGGLWIHPEWRKHGLSGYLTRLARCASLRRFEVDWHCGLVHGLLADKGLPLTAVTGYGYPRMVLAFDSWNPLTNKPDRFYLPWISRAEILDQLAAEITRLVRHRDQESVRPASGS